MRTHWRHVAATGTVGLLLLTGCSGEETEPPSNYTATVAPSPPPDAGKHTGVAREEVPEMSTWTAPAAPTGAQGQPRGLSIVADEVDDTDVDQVAEAFALTMLTPDSSLDLSPSDVTRRAAQWAEATYAEALSAERPSSGGVEWIDLHAEDGYWSAELEPVPGLADGSLDVGPDGLSAERPYLATRTPHNIDQGTEENFAVVVYLARTNTDQPWTVYEFYQEGDYE